MSNPLAIATVTTALAQILRSAAQSAVNGAEVLTSRPDPNAAPQRRIHLFLYQVTENAALRNQDLPTRSANGLLVTRPTVALDLHYLLVLYGNETELETQRILGAVLSKLHATPVLTRQMIHDAIASQGFLSGSNLAEAFDHVKLTPVGITVEEMSRIWSVFFQIPYALSIAYQASVVLIEAEESGQPALPVLQRGKEDRGVEALGSSSSTFPSLEEIHIGLPEDIKLDPRPKSYPSAQLGVQLILIGKNLGGDVVRVRFRHKQFGDPTHPRHLPAKKLVVPADSRTASEVRFRIPVDAAAQAQWPVGRYAVSVQIDRDGKSLEPTNELELPLAPHIEKIAPPNPVRRVAGKAPLTITCTPVIRKEQTVALALGAGSEEIVAAPRNGDTASLQFVIQNAPQVTDLPVRLHVDDLYSQPFERKFGANGEPLPPEMADNQKVTIT